jgi:hypothetical protein
MMVALQRCTRGTAVASGSQQTCFPRVHRRRARQWVGSIHTRKRGHCEVLMFVGWRCFGRRVDVFGDGKRKRMWWEEECSGCSQAQRATARDDVLRHGARGRPCRSSTKLEAAGKRDSKPDFIEIRTRPTSSSQHHVSTRLYFLAACP